MVWRPSYEDGPCFGIYDLQKKEWLLDCFDYHQLFETEEKAKRYTELWKGYDPSRFEIRPHLPSDGYTNANDDG